jgi:hypothetical protein
MDEFPTMRNLARPKVVRPSLCRLAQAESSSKNVKYSWMICHRSVT